MKPMSRNRGKVVVAMSGGVDSSVAALLLKEQGYDVVGLFMRHGTHEPQSTIDHRQSAIRHQGCCSASDAADARFVAGMLGVPFYALNFENEFDGLIDYFADEYANGRTPNPCVVCNSKLKFGRIADYADAVGATYIATGHYATIQERDGQRRLVRARDSQKDQSYVLFGIGRQMLDRALFPIGELTKTEVRDMARDRGFPNCDKPDSVEICFVPDRDYARVVRHRRPDAFQEGDVVNERGGVIGRHQGVGHYTIGQRRGLRIALGTPVYVTQISVADRTVTLGRPDGLYRRELIAERVTWLVDPPTATVKAEVKIRYLHEAAAASIEPLSGDRVRVVFDDPQKAITPGQAAVIYDGAVVSGGGWICGRAEKD